MKHETTGDPDDLRAARTLGRLEAERFDAGLREREGLEREKRLAELAWSPGEVSETWGSLEAAHRIRELEERLDALGSYLQAVEASAPWRLIQWARSLVGRRW